MIELRTLGGLDLHDAQGHELRVISAASKQAALLTYLAIATPRGFHRRDTLLALLWPAPPGSSVDTEAPSSNAYRVA